MSSAETSQNDSFRNHSLEASTTKILQSYYVKDAATIRFCVCVSFQTNFMENKTYLLASTTSNSSFVQMFDLGLIKNIEQVSNLILVREKWLCSFQVRFHCFWLSMKHKWELFFILWGFSSQEQTLTITRIKTDRHENQDRPSPHSGYLHDVDWWVFVISRDHHPH